MTADKEVFMRIFNEMIPFHKTLGITLTEVDDLYALVKITFHPSLVGDPRIQAIHGGVIASAMDSAGGIASSTTLTSMEDKISTIDMRIDYLRSARACDLLIEGRVVRSGNRVITTNMKALTEDGTLIAEGRGVYHVRRKNEREAK